MAKSEREPICVVLEHEFTGRVSSHEGKPGPGEAHASTYVCDEATCIEDALSWVQEMTGRTGKFYRFTGK